MKRVAYLFALVLLTASCGNSKPANEKASTEATAPVTPTIKALALRPGTLEARISYPGDASLSFALYVPSNYVANKKAPVLVLFDPHGDGSYPLNMYKSLADRYGYLLVGSNDSKNGNDRDLTARIISQTLISIYQLLPVDSQRIYAGGFSGGGRVAAMMAMGPNNIQGLVTCGAGFPANMWTSSPPSIVLGIAGNKDPNLNEVVKFVPADERLRTRYQLVRTETKHEWPLVKDFEKVFFAFETFAIRDHLPLSADPKPLAEKINSTLEKEYSQHMAKGNYLAAAGDEEALIKDLEGIEDNMMGVKQRYTLLTADKRFLKAQADDKSLFIEEQQRTQLFMQAFGKMDTTWWMQQMNDLFKEVKANPNAARSDMLVRITGNLSLGCYMNLSKSIAGGNNDTTRYLSAVYRFVDPENSEAWYMSAVIAARDNANDKAISLLKKAIDKGYSDKNRILADPAFSTLNTSPAFSQLLSQLK
jgi:pimeloyl-ACP methyl ester carboxylesterase